MPPRHSHMSDSSYLVILRAAPAALADESKRGFAVHLRVSEFRQARRSNAAVSNRELSGDTRLWGGAALQRCGTV